MEHAQGSQAPPWSQQISVEIFTEHKFCLCVSYSGSLLGTISWRNGTGDSKGCQFCCKRGVFPDPEVMG